MPVPNWFSLFYRSSVATSRSKSAIFSSRLVAVLLVIGLGRGEHTAAVVLARRQHQQPGNRRSDSECRPHLLLLCHICALLLNACGKPSFRYRGCPLRPF